MRPLSKTLVVDDKEKNKMIEVPKDAVTENGYAVYTHEYQGKKYLDIKKLYKDKETGEDAIGKGGLTIDVEKAASLLDVARSCLVS